MKRVLMNAPVLGAVIAMAMTVLPCGVEAQQTARGGSVLSALEREVRGLFDAVSPSIVTIRSACKQSGSPAHPGPSSLSVGSGIILDTAGRIITTARVVENADEYWVETFDERIFPALMLGSSGDIAVLQIEATGLTPAEFGDAGDLGVGSFVASIGNSYGFACGLAWGEVNGFRPDGTIQLSLGVSAGSSGGAIVDTRGRVVGLIKAKISEPYYIETPSATGNTASPFVSRRLELPTSSVSLAIPVSTALRLARNVSETGAGAPAYVGVYVEDLTGWQVEHFKTNQGVLIIGVVEGTPADRYGLTSGDIIRAVGADQVNSVRRFRQVIAQARPGERIMFDVLREGRPLRVTVEMARGEMTDLRAPIDDIPQSTPRTVPMVPVSSEHATVTAVNSDGLSESEASPPVSQRTLRRDTDLRLRMLEQVVDSLMREIETLRRHQAP